ncbi:minor capsid protein [Moraxella sp. ZJ142]|uniref:minor capsid protein n=1 Tax=Moraxella marmotae TaxID=3344520 RepID=UPI0035D51F0F
MKQLINLERLKSYLSVQFQLTVKQIDDFLQSVVFRREISELKHKEVDLLLKKSNQRIGALLIAYVGELKQNWQGLYKHRYQLLADGKTKDASFDTPLRITANVGITLNDMLQNFGEQETKKLTNAIRYAHANNLSNQDLVKIIRGTRARRYQDGILATSTKNAKTLAHTGTAIIESQAKQQFIADNKDIIKGIKVMATLDFRTSTICRHLDGEFMPLDKAIYPPYHYNCRTSFQIVYDGYQQPNKRASINGVTDNISYYEWLKQQPDKYQDEVLGKTRAKLFRDGGLAIERFKQLQLDRNFTPLTLDEMRKLESGAFERVSGSVLKYDPITNGKLAMKRTDWGDLPNVLIAHTKDTITSHQRYLSAKSGNIVSALMLADEMVGDEFLVDIANALAGYGDVWVLPVHAEEMLGRNKIPLAYAMVLKNNLSLNMDLSIVQASKANRTQSNGVERLLKRVSFDGEVVQGRNYLIVDDVITQGGTLADLRAYIENGGGRVVLVSTLNGKPNSAKLPITKATLGQLRKQAGKELEQWWHEQFGYDFSKFTESEARYLAKQIHRYGLDTVRDTLFAARPKRSL